MRGGRLIVIVMAIAVLTGLGLTLVLRHQTAQQRARRQQLTAPR